MRNGCAQNGTTLLETLAVLAIAGTLLTISVPSLLRIYRNHQLDSASSSLRGVVRHARIKALKEKIDHRVVFHDKGAITPNRADLERKQGGGYVTLASYAYSLPEGVKILGGTPTDSMDAMNVTRRGRCDSGSVFLEGHDGAIQAISIKTSCFAASQ